MTKQRKSLIERERAAPPATGRILPTMEETARAVEKLKDEHKRGPGRPKKEHDRTRFTTIIDPDLRAKIKIIAAREDRQIHDVFNEAVAQYVDQYEKERGAIGL
jgi:hypothetical protein